MLKISIEKIKAVAAMQWDVDITTEAAEIMLPEAQEFASRYETEYQSELRSTRRYFRQLGESTDDLPIEKEERRFNALQRFLYELLGNPCGFDDDEKFFQSDYVKNNGGSGKFDVENLPKKEWKTFDDLPVEIKSPRKRAKIPPVPDSPAALELFKRLTDAGFDETLIPKYRDQLGVLADCGIKVTEISCDRGTLTFLMPKNNRELSVEINRARCAIRQHSAKSYEKIYAHRRRDAEDAVKWLLQ